MIFKNLKQALAAPTQVSVLKITQHEVLPETICSMHDLREIYLNSNQAWEIPSFLKDFKKLKKIELVMHNLEKIPPIFFELESLEILTIKNSHITNWNIPIHVTSPITSLNLSHNLLFEIPPSIEQMRTLKTLFLSHNKINTISNALMEIKTLQRLNLDNNLLEQIPEFILESEQLNYLSLDGNPLDEKSRKNLEIKFKLSNL